MENTWDELVRSSDLIAEVEPVSSAGGGVTHYYGSFTSVVTAYSVSITRVIAGGDRRGTVPGSRISTVETTASSRVRFRSRLEQTLGWAYATLVFTDAATMGQTV